MPSFSAFLLAVIGHVQLPIAVIAHQGGWDEFLMVAAPVGIFAALLISANRRAARLEEDGGSGQDLGSDQGRDDGAGESSTIIGPESPRNERGGPI